MTGNLNISKELYTSIHKCTRCGQCTYGTGEAEYVQLCPINKQGKFFSYSAGGLMQIARSLFEGKLDFNESLKDILFRCTTCGICESNCGVIYDHQEIMSEMRQGFIQKNPDSVKPLVNVLDAIIEKKNPYGRDNAQRTSWRKKSAVSKGKKEILYFTGCVSSFDQKAIPKAFTGILDILNISYEISDDEWCCGLPLYYNGYESKAVDLARHNIEMIKNSSVDTIVFSCPTCMLAFKKFYPKWLNRELPFKIMHSTQYLNQLMSEGKLKPVKEIIKKSAVYHDSCHLGRELQIFDEPRNLLAEFSGNGLEEFELKGENSFCCGGGGMVPVSDPHFSNQIGSQRINQMADQGPQMLVMACPNCKKTLSLAARKMKIKIKVLDVVEVVYKELCN